jgi:hypothetical protein
MRFEALQAVAIAASQERSLKVLLERIVSGLAKWKRRIGARVAARPYQRGLPQ